MAGDYQRGIRLKSARRSLRVSAAATLLLFAGAGAVHDATASNDTRTLSFHHTHSGEDLTVTFKRNGRYDADSLKKLNHFLRDWRSQDSTTMDPHLFDILWEVYRDVDARQPIQIISAYRSPKTNAMLRRRSAHSGVARFSQHMLGHAMDFFIPGVPLEKIRFAGLRLQRGGVGFYPTSGSPFVHLDTGGIRHWPRMTHDQLARVFPDGKTVHIPTDGRPLKGYDVALAEIQRRKGDDAAPSRTRTLLASLFKGRSSSEDDEESSAAAPAAVEAPARPSVIASAAETVQDKIQDKIAEIVPVPRARPVQTASYRVASAVPDEIPLASAKPAARRPQTMAEMIEARVRWDDDAMTPTPASAEQLAAVRARAADPQSTASLPANVANAMAYASPQLLDRSKIIAASAPVPPTHVAALARDAAVSVHATVVAGKKLRGQIHSPATMLRLANADQASDIWLRAMVLAPNANSALRTSVMGDWDMRAMAAHFVKPARAVTMTFSLDPLIAPACDRFSGQAVASMPTTDFVQTASLR
ncbi:Ribonucleases G and E OS=Afipia felis OX=1035 GN=NCTC12722_01107 PE=4 SV=1 [Afipia felis]